MSSFWSTVWRGALRGILAGFGGQQSSSGGNSYASRSSDSIAYFEMLDPGSSHWIGAGAGVNSPGSVSDALKRIASLNPGRRVRAVDRKGKIIDIL
jgi:hypothetical protein